MSVSSSSGSSLPLAPLSPVSSQLSSSAGSVAYSRPGALRESASSNPCARSERRDHNVQIAQIGRTQHAPKYPAHDFDHLDDWARDLRLHSPGIGAGLYGSGDQRRVEDAPAGDQ